MYIEDATGIRCTTSIDRETVRILDEDNIITLSSNQYNCAMIIDILTGENIPRHCRTH